MSALTQTLKLVSQLEQSAAQDGRGLPPLSRLSRSTLRQRIITTKPPTF